MAAIPSGFRQSTGNLVKRRKSEPPRSQPIRFIVRADRARKSFSLVAIESKKKVEEAY
jgi:hypothetical protein